MLDNNISAQLLKTLNTQRRKNRKDLYAEKYRVKGISGTRESKRLRRENKRMKT